MESHSRTLAISIVLVVGAGAGCTQFRKVETTVLPKTYLSAETLARRLNLRVREETPAYAILSDNHNTIQIFTGQHGSIYINGEVYGQPDNAIYEKDKVWVLAARERVLRMELNRLAPPRPPPSPEPVMPPRPTSIDATIVVDAGHGGKDPGALGTSRVPEKVIVLDIAQRLRNELEARGARVIMTRDDDTFIPLDDRAAMADRYRVDLFVSVHADSSQNSDAEGQTIYVARNASITSIRVAQSIHRALERASFPSRGVRRAGYRVLVGHSRPAVLIETGFLTNSSEARRLASPDYRARLARVIADGIAAFFMQ
jgi:N-acetylmuramoyl-L-alanine amidase